mgnify:FL=1|tara:strand:+ start:1197 stop:2078 length:882 start_codon:yes stop_codon:yes gene_type:complete
MKQILFLLLIFNLKLFSQTVNCNFVLNSDFVDQTNQQVFSTLEKSVNEFMNSNLWNDKSLEAHQRVKFNLILNLNSYVGSNFTGTLQVQVERPIYESTYLTPIFNFLDKDISFQYDEYQPLFYNPVSFESNLISILSFYVYVAMGMEADTFRINSGTTFFKEAQKIVSLAQQNNIKGWNQSDGTRNRFWLVDTLLSNTFREYRTVQYEYHRRGMDFMTTDLIKAKKGVLFSLEKFLPLYKRRPNAFLIQTFFDAKSDEIVDIFSQGPEIEIKQTLKTLNRVAPYFGPKWKKIR